MLVHDIWLEYHEDSGVTWDIGVWLPPAEAFKAIQTALDGVTVNGVLLCEVMTEARLAAMPPGHEDDLDCDDGRLYYGRVVGVKPEPFSLDASKIDWALLRTQKYKLLTGSSDGLVEFLDYVMDEAAMVIGEEAVFGPKVTIKGVVRLHQRVDELSDVDDREELPAGNMGAGSYKDYPIEVTFTRQLPLDWKNDSGETEAEEALLNEFNESVPIGCLEDFHQQVLTITESDQEAKRP